MRMKTEVVLWGSLGLLLAAGSAQAADQPPEVTGSEIVNQMAGKPVCRDAGVTVSFTTGSSELDLNGRGALNGVATWMKAKEDRTLHLQGYADTTGNSESNLKLSEQRADAVKDYLASQGVPAEHIVTAGRGEISDHLPANGRTVTFLVCEPAAPVAGAEPAPEAEPPAAEPEPAPPPVAVAPVLTPVETPPSDQGEVTLEPYGSKFGFGFMVGGGYQDFTNTNMRDLTNGAGSWTARLIGGTRSYVGFEAAYVGAARAIRPLGNATSSNLVSNGAEGALRINIPIVAGHSLIEPFGFVGIGWQRYSVTNFSAAVTSDFTSTDNIMTVPIGTGIAYSYKAFMVDARGNWTPTYYNDLLVASNRTGTLNTWGVGSDIGFAF